jgi:hypothetical protein
MLIVMPFGGRPDKTEPDLDDLRGRLLRTRKLVAQRFRADERRQGILGISMGAKQALSVVLKEKDRAGFSALGLLSGKFQDNNLRQVKDYVPVWPSSLGSELALYFHYCGAGDDMPREGKQPLTGDRRFFDNNQVVSTELAGRKVRTRADGLHNWYFWRPALAEFLKLVSQMWCPRA